MKHDLDEKEEFYVILTHLHLKRRRHWGKGWYKDINKSPGECVSCVSCKSMRRVYSLYRVYIVCIMCIMYPMCIVCVYRVYRTYPLSIQPSR